VASKYSSLQVLYASLRTSLGEDQIDASVAIHQKVIYHLKSGLQLATGGIAECQLPPNLMVVYHKQTLFELLGRIKSGRNPVTPSQFIKMWYPTGIQDCSQLEERCWYLVATSWLNMMHRPYLTYRQQSKVVATSWFCCNPPKRDLLAESL